MFGHLLNIMHERVKDLKCYLLDFLDEGPYHIETGPLICNPNQWTGFYMVGTSVVKELLKLKKFILLKILYLASFLTIT